MEVPPLRRKGNSRRPSVAGILSRNLHDTIRHSSRPQAEASIKEGPRSQGGQAPSHFDPIISQSSRDAIHLQERARGGIAGKDRSLGSTPLRNPADDISPRFRQQTPTSHPHPRPEKDLPPRMQLHLHRIPHLLPPPGRINALAGLEYRTAENMPPDLHRRYRLPLREQHVRDLHLGKPPHTTPLHSDGPPPTARPHPIPAHLLRSPQPRSGCGFGRLEPRLGRGRR